MAAIARLNRIWRCNIISFASKLMFCKTLVTSILLYGCETWTLLADSEKKILAFETLVPKETSQHLLLGAKDHRLGAEQDQLSWGSTGTSSGNWQQTETCMVRARHTPRQPLQNHPSGHLGRVGDAVVGIRNAGRTTLKSGHPCPCKNSSQGPHAEKTGRGSLLNRPSCPPDDPIGQGTELNCLWLKRAVGGELVSNAHSATYWTPKDKAYLHSIFLWKFAYIQSFSQKKYVYHRSVNQCGQEVKTECSSF